MSSTSSIHIAKLHDTLALPLLQIIEAKHYYPLKHQSWSQDLFPQIKHRISTIIDLIPNPNDPNDPNEVYKDTTEKATKIIKHLDTHFKHSPPFSILRLAEILYDPVREGYNLDTVIGVLKYLNSLSKIVLVTSSIEKFPEPRLKDEQDPQQVEDVPLVKIPWLDKVLNKDTSEKDTSEKEDSITGEQDKRPMDTPHESHSKRSKIKEGDSMEIETSFIDSDSDSTDPKPGGDQPGDEQPEQLEQPGDEDKLDMSIDHDDSTESLP